MRKSTLICLLALIALPLVAQQPAPPFKVPRASQKQVLTQSVGNTDVTIVYSRPAVKGRAIWGALVPYDKVWRTGANEATTIAFTDDVTINGQPLPKGTYSLHTIPAASGEWTLIFNKTANQWGSFSYDEKQDALRVKAKAEKSPFTEALVFDIPQLDTDKATVVIRWENIGVPFTVATGTTEKTLAAARRGRGGEAGGLADADARRLLRQQRRHRHRRGPQVGRQVDRRQRDDQQPLPEGAAPGEGGRQGGGESYRAEGHRQGGGEGQGRSRGDQEDRRVVEVTA
jgi:hypothetical protein